MQKNKYFPMTLLAVAVLSGCSSMPQSTLLTEAHTSYDSALNDPQVTKLAPVELKDAGDSLNKADKASSKDDSADTVNQLAYIAKQKVEIARATASQKAAELTVANAAAKRDNVRLEARTAEADASKRQATIAQRTVDQQAAALASAGANAQRDQTLIAQQDMQLKALNAKKTERGMVITLGDVLFNTNKAQVKPGGMRNVQKLADFLNRYPQQKVLIEGYTDSTGSVALNQDLSDRRANSVRMALVDMGVNSDRVTTRGYGEEYPIASNDTAANRQLNRRVEIILSDDSGNIIAR